MNTKILIVEDQFIEANDLRIILEKAGYVIFGIAKSVEQALQLIRNNIPDMVLLDIYLKGAQTGIDLAKILARQNIPFIYLSANSNPKTFEEAKTTQPYGFLVKPYRERDILNALEIASYRHVHTVDLIVQQERAINSSLLRIINQVSTPAQKMLLLAKAFKSYVSFDFMVVDTDMKNEDLNVIYCFERIDFDDYDARSGWEFMKKSNLDLEAVNSFRKQSLKINEILLETGDDFMSFCSRNYVIERIKDTYELYSRLWVPLTDGGSTEMSISFYSRQSDGLNSGHLDLLSALSTLLSMVILKIKNQQSALKNSKVTPDAELSKTSHQTLTVQGIIGKSPKLLHVLDQAFRVAPVNTTVLIMGETGVGKEGLVMAIHQHSPRKNMPLIKINCAAIPNGLIESELFGHEKGAFTGAFERRIGKFEQANGGTIFLDEIGELPLGLQSKLLRVLQEKEVERVGGRMTVKIDVRVIVATNRNLYKEVALGNFRMDLYYRINIFPIIIPPLRERKEDISLLANYFLEHFAGCTKSATKRLAPEVLQKLQNYSWPGNIRELQHVMERYNLIAPSTLITTINLNDDFPTQIVIAKPEEKFKSINEIDKEHIVAALKRSNGKVSGIGGAAEILNLPATTLASKMKKLGIGWKY